MSPHSVERRAWSSTTWVWLLLAVCLIGWRIGSRVEHYRPPAARAQHQAQVTFFDANDRNIAAIDATRSQPRLVSEQTNRMLPATDPKPSARAADRPRPEARAALPPIYVDAVSLFSNPPPAESLT